MDVNHIYGNIYIGSMPEKGLALYRSQFRVLVLCAQELEIYQLDRDYPGLHVIRCPIDDAELSKHEAKQVRNCSVDLVRASKILGNSGNILVTCHQGRNRSGLVCALVIRKLLSIDGRKARQIVQAHRKDSLTNPSFALFLDSLPISIPQVYDQNPQR